MDVVAWISTYSDLSFIWLASLGDGLRWNNIILIERIERIALWRKQAKQGDERNQKLVIVNTAA